MITLYTNRTARGDLVANALSAYGRDCGVKVASAFFSDAVAVADLVSRGCTVDLVVRLGHGTDAQALSECVGMDGVNIRYFAHTSYHPKFFIFGGSCALVGSANLTRSGLGKPDGSVNQEACVVVRPEDPDFERLADYFAELWDSAHAFGSAEAAHYREAMEGLPDPREGVRAALARSGLELGRFRNLGGRSLRLARESLYSQDHQRRYQKALGAIRQVTNAYAAGGVRLEPRVPLAIEVDQLFNFLRERAPGDGYRDSPILFGDARGERIEGAVAKYRLEDPGYLHVIAEERYPAIAAVFGSAAALEAANADDLWAALSVVHALKERQRYFEGGLAAMRGRILDANGVERVRRTLRHLAFGAGAPANRVADCLFGDFRLQEFGESCVQETLGWARPDEAPIVNRRTLVALRLLGFDVEVPA